jgi:hypothetical protein
MLSPQSLLEAFFSGVERLPQAHPERNRWKFVSNRSNSHFCLILNNDCARLPRSIRRFRLAAELNTSSGIGWEQLEVSNIEQNYIFR